MSLGEPPPVSPSGLLACRPTGLPASEHIRISRLTSVTSSLDVDAFTTSTRLLVLSEIVVCTSYPIEFFVGKIKFDVRFRSEFEAFCQRVVGK